MIEALRLQPFVSVWRQTANQKSSWQRANFARYPSQPLTFSHAPRRSHNIHTQTRPHKKRHSGGRTAGGFSTLLLLSNGTALQPQSSSRAHLAHCYISKYTHGSWLEVSAPLLIFIGWSYNFASFSALASTSPRFYSVKSPIHRHAMLVACMFIRQLALAVKGKKMQPNTRKSCNTFDQFKSGFIFSQN